MKYNLSNCLFQGKADRETVAWKPCGGRGETEYCSLSALFSIPPPVYQLRVRPLIGQLWQFTSTLTSVIQLGARRVLQTCEVYETLLQRTFWRFEIWHFDMRNGVLGHWPSSVWIKVFKKMLKGPPFLSFRRFFTRSLFYCSLSFLGSSALTKSLVQPTLQLSRVKMCETQWR